MNLEIFAAFWVVPDIPLPHLYFMSSSTTGNPSFTYKTLKEDFVKVLNGEKIYGCKHRAESRGYRAAALDMSCNIHCLY